MTPGTPCYLIRCDAHPESVGRVVTTTGPAQAAVCHFEDGLTGHRLVVPIEADWLPPKGPGRGWAVPPSWLRPLAGPDAARMVEQERVRESNGVAR